MWPDQSVAIIASDWLVLDCLLLLKYPFVPVFQEHPGQFFESTWYHTEEPILFFFLSKRSMIHNSPQWSRGTADQTWRPRKKTTTRLPLSSCRHSSLVNAESSRSLFFFFFFFQIRQEQWNKGKFHLLLPICPNILSGIKNMSTDTPIQLYAGDLLLARPLWHSHPLGIPPKVWTLNILDLGQRHCPHWGGEQERWPTIPPVSAVWSIRSNQCAIFSLFLSWESGRCLWNNPPTPTPTTTQTLDRWPKGGDVYWDNL